MVLTVSPSDRVVVVTGGSQGLGLEWVDQYSRDQNTFIVAVVDSIRFDLTKLVQRRRNISIIIDFDPLDFSSFNVVAEDIARVTGGRVDILINTAGTAPGTSRTGTQAQGTLDESTIEEWRKTYDLHTLSPVFFTLALLPLLRNGTEKKVVNVDSTVDSTDGEIPHVSVYPTRAALWAATEQLHYDYREEGFTFITTNPSYVDNSQQAGENGSLPLHLAASVARQKSWVDKVTPKESGGHYSHDRSNGPVAQ